MPRRNPVIRSPHVKVSVLLPRGLHAAILRRRRLVRPGKRETTSSAIIRLLETALGMEATERRGPGRPRIPDAAPGESRTRVHVCPQCGGEAGRTLYGMPRPLLACPWCGHVGPMRRRTVVITDAPPPASPSEADDSGPGVPQPDEL